jgi:hypothetical protein
MKLAEALIERKRLKELESTLRNRLVATARLQEGEQPPEPPEALLRRLDEVIRDLDAMTRRIQATNHAHPFGEATLAAAITQRDMLRLRQQAYNAIAQAATGEEKGFRFSRDEIRTVPTLSVADLRGQADAAAKQWRELDARIQSTNWQVEIH